MLILNTECFIIKLINYALGENPIEAIYMFPIEEEAAVVNFTAEVEGRTIKTEVRKKEEAKAAYDKAMQVFKLLSVIVSTCLLTDYIYLRFVFA